MLISGVLPPAFGAGMLGAQDEAYAVVEVAKDIDAMRAGKAALDAAPKPEEKRKIEERLAEVRRRAEALEAKFPESAKVQTKLAALATQDYDFKKGLARSEKAVALARSAGDKETFADALNTRSLAKWYTGDFPGAARDAQQALEARPGDPVADAVLKLSQRKVPALGAALKASAADARLREKLDDLLTLSELLQRPEARAAGDRAAARQAALRRLDEAVDRLRLQDGEGAARAAEGALKLDPALPDGYMQRALAWTLLRQPERAAEDLEKAIALWRALPRKDGDQRPLAAAHALRAQAFLDQRRPAEAFRDAERAVTLAPASGLGYLRRAQAREALEQAAADILADYKRAAELDPKSYAADYEAAAARLGGGKAPGAPAGGGGRGAAALALAAAALALLAASWRLLRGRGAPEAAPEAAQALLAGRFRVDGRLGSGGMGVVYKAWDTVLQRAVAVKRMNDLLRDDPTQAERFISEARIVGALKHPAIVAIHDAVKDGGDLCLVFELVEGETLSDALERGPLSPAECLRVFSPVCEAVDFAHSRQVIHRDLKPSNIMLEGGRVKVMDFGIARRTKAADGRTLTALPIGTPPYMAPELESGEVSRQSDTFALGVTAYQSLTGRLPFASQEDKKAGLIAAAPPGCEAFFRTALAPRREDRFASAGELYAALRRALS